MSSDPVPRRTEARLIYAGSLLLALFLGYRLYSLGGPYFEKPRTIIDHVGTTPHETREALLVLPRAAKLLPRNAEVTCFRPRNGQAWDDDPVYLTAIGQLRRQNVLPPFTARLQSPREELIEYVIAIGEPFQHPAYAVVAEWPEGRLYRLRK